MSIKTLFTENDNDLFCNIITANESFINIVNIESITVQPAVNGQIVTVKNVSGDTLFDVNTETPIIYSKDQQIGGVIINDDGTTTGTFTTAQLSSALSGGGGSGNISGSLTSGTVPLATGTHTLGDSDITESAGVVNIGLALFIDTNVSSVSTANNTLDDGSGNTVVSGELTINGDILSNGGSQNIGDNLGNEFNNVYCDNIHVTNISALFGVLNINDNVQSTAHSNIGSGPNPFNQVACTQVAIDIIYPLSSTNIVVNAELDFASPILYNVTNSSAGTGYVAMEPLQMYEYVSDNVSGVAANTNINVPIPTGKSYTDIRKLECTAVVSSGFFTGVWNQTDTVSLSGQVFFTTFSSNTNIFIKTGPSWGITSDPVTFYLLITTI